MDIERIEAGVTSILHRTTEICLAKEMGITQFRYKNIGEVFQLPNECKVHILPGFEESIMIVRGASLVALSRSFAEPIKKNLIWQMKVRRNKTGGSIPHTKAFVITDDTISKLPVIIEHQPGEAIQQAANALMDAYKGFRGQWKRRAELENAAQLVSQDLEGILPVQADKSNEFRQPREQVKDLPHGIDL